MLTASPAKEILVKVRNEIGVLYQLSQVLSDRGINLLAICGWVEGDNGLIRLVTDDHRRALDLLQAKNFHAEERDIVCVRLHQRIGMLKIMTEELAREGIGLRRLYASSPPEAASCGVYLATTNNDHAVVALNKIQGVQGQ